jgi:hypothetical protein
MSISCSFHRFANGKTATRAQMAFGIAVVYILLYSVDNILTYNWGLRKTGYAELKLRNPLLRCPVYDKHSDDNNAGDERLQRCVQAEFDHNVVYNLNDGHARGAHEHIAFAPCHLDAADDDGAYGDYIDIIAHIVC